MGLFFTWLLFSKSVLKYLCSFDVEEMFLLPVV